VKYVCSICRLITKWHRQPSLQQLKDHFVPTIFSLVILKRDRVRRSYIISKSKHKECFKDELALFCTDCRARGVRRKDVEHTSFLRKWLLPRKSVALSCKKVRPVKIKLLTLKCW